MSLHISVHGTPAPQGSKRYLGRANGKGVMVESSKRVAPWRADVRDAAMQALGPPDKFAGLWTAPLTVSIQFRLDRPKGHYGTGRNSELLRAAAPIAPTGKPDLDKLIRAVLDALTGIVWQDDKRIVHIEAWKTYGKPGADITVSEVSP